MRPTAFLVLAFAPAVLAAQEAPHMDVGLDHVILATGDLERGSAEFARRTGVTPRFGGQHPGRGTQNALVSLGSGQYLELLAPVVGTKDSARVALLPGGWALHTSDLDAMIVRLRAAGFSVTGPTPGSRLTPDSAMLRWRTASVRGPELGQAPFFIEWARETAHPSTTAPAGCRLSALEIVAPDTTRLHAFFAAVEYPAVLRAGPAPRIELTLSCPSGTVRFAP